MKWKLTSAILAYSWAISLYFCSQTGGSSPFSSMLPHFITYDQISCFFVLFFQNRLLPPLKNLVQNSSFQGFHFIYFLPGQNLNSIQYFRYLKYLSFSTGTKGCLRYTCSKLHGYVCELFAVLCCAGKLGRQIAMHSYRFAPDPRYVSFCCRPPTASNAVSWGPADLALYAQPPRESPLPAVWMSLEAYQICY